MKCLSKLTLLAFVLLAALALAQNGPFKHVIIIVQENRTPDNLFGAGAPNHVGPCGGQDDFELGVDIENGGYVWVNGADVQQCSIPLPLNGWDQNINNGVEVDPDHAYEGFGKDYTLDNGQTFMDGFCHRWDRATVGCPPYSYVQKSDVQPYFDAAMAYGFANYMFQSNEGPSMPAHQFLFTGTSAPVAPGNPPYSQYFVGDNLQNQPAPSGCPYGGSLGWPRWVFPDGSENPGDTECYTHDSLVTAQAECNSGDTGDSCDRGIDSLPSIMAWGYYVEPKSEGYGIWDAPAYIPEACYGENSTFNYNLCGSGPSGESTEWSDHVRIPKGQIPYQPTGTYYSWAPILDDILACKLPAVSWVIPDGSYSDHPTTENPSATSVAIGPSWVADIIDTVGQSYQLTGKCDYWDYPSQQGADQEPTAIFVVWDDWGGWFDHIKPWIARQENPQNKGYTACDPSTQWGCGYTDGFRVPLLVVSPYTPAGYVSGACQLGSCPNFGQNDQYVHDFGSILGFTEWNFAMPFIDGADKGYADYNAPDWQQNYTIPPLSDFFPLSPKRGQGPSFTYITPASGATDQCFQYHTGTDCPLAGSWTPTDPDSY